MFFRTLFCMQRYDKPEYELKEAVHDPLETLSSVLKFLYTGKMSLTKETFSTVLTWAEILQISSLKVVQFPYHVKVVLTFRHSKL